MTPRLVARPGVALILGVSQERVRQLIEAGRLPPPDALVDGKPAWKPAKIRAYAKRR